MKQQRNSTCLCGSGLKYKRCCWQKILHAPKLSEIPRVEPPKQDKENTDNAFEYRPRSARSLLMALASVAALSMPTGNYRK